MPAVEVVPAAPEHALALALTMREADRAEVLASDGLTPLQALQASVANSEAACTLLLDGEPAAMFGVAAMGDGAGRVWLLTGEAVSRHPRAFLRLCRPVVATMLERYPVLVNAIDARYAAALRWARWLGAEVGEPEPFGIAGAPFCPIRLRRDAWAGQQEQG